MSSSSRELICDERTPLWYCTRVIQSIISQFLHQCLTNPVIATLYPCEQNFFAITFPIPDVDPVTSATLDIFSEFGMRMES